MSEIETVRKEIYPTAQEVKKELDKIQREKKKARDNYSNYISQVNKS